MGAETRQTGVRHAPLEFLPQPQREPPPRADLLARLRERLPRAEPLPAGPPALDPEQPQPPLKLTTVRRCNDEWADGNAYLVYASQEARDSIRGWLDAAATAWGVQSLVVTLPEDVRADLLRAQATQVMVNPPTPQ